MVNPDFGGDAKPTMFICGNNDDTKRKVHELIEKFGFEIEDGRQKAQEQLNHYAYYGAYLGFLRTSGHTLSSY